VLCIKAAFKNIWKCQKAVLRFGNNQTLHYYKFRFYHVLYNFIANLK
jgi:hypothetical protein